MAYTKTQWNPQGAPGISAEKLNKIEQGIEDAHKAIEEPLFLTETFTEQIHSLPDSTVKGQLNATLKGMTVVNLLDDDMADCENTSGWVTATSSLVLDSSNKLFGSNAFKITLSSTAGAIYRDILNKLNTSKYYLVTAYIKNGNLSGNGIRLRVNCVDDAGFIEGDYVTDTNYIRKGIVLQPSDFDTASEVRITFSCYGATDEYAYVDGIMVNEITAEEYAEGVEALLEKYNWHKGTKSTVNTRLKSVGKNLFDKSKARVATVDANGNITSSTGNIISGYIPIKPNTDYRWSLQDTTNYVVNGFIVYDINKQFISFLNPAGETTPSNAHYTIVRFRRQDGGDMTFDDINVAKPMLEEGSSATDYEPYKESVVYLDQNLRSLPNGVKDEVKDGKLYKRIEKIILNNDNSWVARSDTLVNVYAFEIEGFPTSYNAKKDIYSDGLIATSDDGNYPNIVEDTRCAFITATGFRVRVEKSIIDAQTGSTRLEKFNNYLSTFPISLIYQLAEPVVTELPAQILSCEPNGTVYVEPVVFDVGYYNSGITIDDTSLPIKNIVRVSKINTDDGSLTDVDLSNVTVAGDGLSFTISTATNGEWYEYEYEYDSSLTTIPELTLGIPANHKAQTNSNTDAIKTLDKSLEMYLNILMKREDISITVGTVSNGAIIPQTPGFNNYIYFVSPNEAPYVDTVSGGDNTSWIYCSVDQSTREVTMYTHSNSTYNSGDTSGTANYIEIAWNGVI